MTDKEKTDGLKAMQGIGEVLRANPGAYASPVNGSILMNGLAAFDPNGESKEILLHVEEGGWLAEDQGWSAKDLASVAQACSKIRSTRTVPILASLTKHYMVRMDEMTTQEVAAIAKAFTSAGVVHPELSRAVTRRTMTLLKDATVDDLSRILIALPQPLVPELVDGLGKKIAESVAMMSPGAVARCCAVLAQIGSGLSSPGLKASLQARALDIVAMAPLADTVEITKHLATLRSKEEFEAAMPAITDRLIQFKEQLSPGDITSIFVAIGPPRKFFSEDLLSALAERTVKLIERFEVSELSTILRVLADFDLYDPELFPLVALKVQHITRQKVLLDPGHVTNILDAFARLKEKNDNILFSAQQQLKLQLHSMDKETCQRSLAAFDVFKFNQRDIIGQLRMRLEYLMGGAPSSGNLPPSN